MRCAKKLGRVLALAWALGGCAAGGVPGTGPHLLTTAPGEYNYTGINSVTVNGQVMGPAQGLRVHAGAIEATLAQVSPTGQPVAGRARIVVPDHPRLRLLAAQNAAAAHQTLAGVIEYQTERMRLEIHSMGDLLRLSHTFASETLTEENNTIAPDPAGADWVVWYAVAPVPNTPGRWVGLWLVRRGGSTEILPAAMDPGAPEGVQRAMTFVASVRADAARLASGAGAAGASGTGMTGSGTGIVLDAQGHVLTDQHVIAGCPALRVRDAAGEEATARLLASDPANDLALLETGRHWAGQASFRSGRDLRPGEGVVVTGFPLAGLVGPDMAVTTGSLTTLSGLGGDTRILQFSAPVQPGNSGGPLMDEGGRVIGVVRSIVGRNSATLGAGLPVLEGVSFATKTDTVRQFLDANHVSVAESAGHNQIGAAAVGEAGRHFTLRVECWRN